MCNLSTFKRDDSGNWKRKNYAEEPALEEDMSLSLRQPTK